MRTCTLHRGHWTLNTKHSTVNIAQCTLNSAQWTINMAICSLGSSSQNIWRVMMVSVEPNTALYCNVMNCNYLYWTTQKQPTLKFSTLKCPNQSRHHCSTYTVSSSPKGQPKEGSFGCSLSHVARPSCFWVCHLGRQQDNVENKTCSLVARRDCITCVTEPASYLKLSKCKKGGRKETWMSRNLKSLLGIIHLLLVHEFR